MKTLMYIPYIPRANGKFSRNFTVLGMMLSEKNTYIKCCSNPPFLIRGTVNDLLRKSIKASTEHYNPPL